MASIGFPWPFRGTPGADWREAAKTLASHGTPDRLSSNTSDAELVWHRAPEQWRFLVLPANSLRANLRDVGLHDLEEITDAVGFESLAGAVRETFGGL